METNKLIRARELFLKGNAGSSRNSGASTGSTLKEETYEKRLVKDIEKTQLFLNQANKALMTLRTVDYAASDSERDRKRRVIALYNSYQKIPYSSNKDDAIGIATTSRKFEEAVRDTKKSIEHLKKTSNSDEIEALKSIIKDFRRIFQITEKVIGQKQELVTDIEEKLASVGSEEQRIRRQSKHVLDRATEDAKTTEKLLGVHLKRVITKFLAVHDLEYSKLSDETTLRTSLKNSQALLLNLLRASDDKWVEVIPNRYNSGIIKALLMNDLAHSREDSTADIEYLRLRNYGI
ncbi:uncharacterized protein RJT20DRAFT_22798 [Scheffersomyces xylosifermentans]|uniref:uncharacterized protein n=1 Tax=Scheffersomyces xylosifermentans TaxID=1304137 RepID=UPI00315D0234